MKIDPVGLWTFQFDLQPVPVAHETLRRIEAMGWRMVWIPEAVGREPFANAATMLSATERLGVATGIASLHARTAMTMNAGWQTMSDAFPDRFLLGIGVSHRSAVEKRHKGTYERPLATMAEYLDAMDNATFAAHRPERLGPRVIAALGPKMLRLAADRTAGAHTYFVPVEHTAVARETLGPGPLLLPEQAVVLTNDGDVGRQVAVRYMRPYLEMPNYTNNLRRLGWSEDDIRGPSTALVKALVAWGNLDAVAARITAHLEAGADHVAIQVLPQDPRSLPIAEWQLLSEAFSLS